MNSEHGASKAFLSKYSQVLIFLLITTATLIAYYQVGSHDFISLDDDQYVTQNPVVKAGITLKGIVWAFDSSTRSYWHPLTWLSHMFDCQIFGLNAGAHHLVNLFFHVANALLFFLVLRTMTGSVWRSAFASALFALHPINVDTVAWLAERKNVLSTFFWLITMLSYIFYTRNSSLWRYCIVCCLFVLGLLAKPMLVTLPFVFLLLDYWPLRRIELEVSEHKGKRPVAFNGIPITRLILEKIPLILISIVSIVLSSLSIQKGGFTITTEMVPMGLRISNAIVSYVVYLGKMFWPVNLTFFYPYPDAVPLWQVFVASIILILLSAGAVRLLIRAPYIAVGWFWFLGTLVPVSGIMQGGIWPAIAERWAYVPFIGLFIVLAWGVPDILGAWKFRKKVLQVVAAGILVLFIAMTWRQVGYWKDDFTLFSHGIRINPENFLAQANLGKAYAERSEHDKAAHHFQEALRIHPNDTLVLNNLSLMYKKRGDLDKAQQYAKEVIHYSPRDVDARLRLGDIYAVRGDLDSSIGQFSEVIAITSGHDRAYYNLGVLWGKKGEVSKAAHYLSLSLKMDPYDAETHVSMGVVMMNIGRVQDAIDHFSEALRIDPGSDEARSYKSNALDYMEKINKKIARLEQQIVLDPENTKIINELSVMYAHAGEEEKALGILHRFVGIQPDNPESYYNIACLYARVGEVDKAVQWLNEAIEKGFVNWELIEKDPDLNNIRDTEYFKKLVQDNKAPGTGQ